MREIDFDNTRLEAQLITEKNNYARPETTREKKLTAATDANKLLLQRWHFNRVA